MIGSVLLAISPPPSKKTDSKHIFALVKIFLLIWDALMCSVWKREDRINVLNNKYSFMHSFTHFFINLSRKNFFPDWFCCWHSYSWILMSMTYGCSSGSSLLHIENKMRTSKMMCLNCIYTPREHERMCRVHLWSRYDIDLWPSSQIFIGFCRVFVSVP